MANPFRTETALEVGGRRLVLRLTLGALAELEAAFGAQGLAHLGERLGAGHLRAEDLVTLAGALLRGGGERLSDTEVAALFTARDLPPLVEAVAGCFAATLAENAPRP